MREKVFTYTERDPDAAKVGVLAGKIVSRLCDDPADFRYEIVDSLSQGKSASINGTSVRMTYTKPTDPTAFRDAKEYLMDRGGLRCALNDSRRESNS